MNLPDGLSFDAFVTVGDEVADEIVMHPFVTLVTAGLGTVEVLTKIFDSTIAFGPSSDFAAFFSSFDILAVLFVKMLDGDALYDSEVMAANGFGGGCSVICCGELIGLLKFCIAFNGDDALLPPIDTIVIIGRFSIEP